MQWHTNTLYTISRIQSYPMDFHNKKTISTFPQSIWTFFETRLEVLSKIWKSLIKIRG
jgi:AAA15 family ATPase/GTPase